MSIIEDAVSMRLIEPARAKEIRERSGLSKDRFALELNVNPATVHRWEAGTSCPRGGMRLRYARLLAELESIIRAA